MENRKKVEIGHIDLGRRPVFLVPMENVTDLAFRLTCKKFGADMVYTKFVSSDALIRSANKTTQKLIICDEGRLVTIQIYGKDTEAMVGAARIVEEVQPDILDINFGHPIKRAAGKGTGAGMLQNIPKTLEVACTVVDAVKIPVTVKTHLGWDADHKTTVDLAEQLQDYGIVALAVRRRTRTQMYTDEANWILIGEIRNNPRIHIPIIGNGDVASATDAKECFEWYRVDAIVIGRGNISRPRISREVKYYLETGEELPQKSFEWYLSVLREEMLSGVAHLGKHRGIIHIRRHLAATPLFKGIPSSRKTRTAVLRTESVEGLSRIFDGLHPIT